MKEVKKLPTMGLEQAYSVVDKVEKPVDEGTRHHYEEKRRKLVEELAMHDVTAQESRNRLEQMVLSNKRVVEQQIEDIDFVLSEIERMEREEPSDIK